MDTEIDILVIEDTDSDATLAVHELHRHGIAQRIQVLGTAAEALDFIFCRGAYRSRSLMSPPKMVLLDLNLPDGNGLQVLKAMKGDLRTCMTPVVIMTSSDDPEELIAGYRLGVNSVIQKPINFSDFRKIMERIATFWLGVNKAPPVAFRN